MVGNLAKSLRSTLAPEVHSGRYSIGETRRGAVGGHALEMCLCLYLPSAHSLYFISTQNIRVCAPDGAALPQVNISFDQIQVKSLCVPVEMLPQRSQEAYLSHTCLLM